MPTTAEYLARLVQAKSDIATAITTAGGTVNQGDGFEEFPADIATISGGSSSAVCDLTPVTAGITNNSLKAINLPDRTLVFGGFTNANSGNNVFSFPNDFTFSHTTVIDLWLLNYGTTAAQAYAPATQYAYSVDTTNRTFTVNVVLDNEPVYIACYFA